MKVTFKNNYFVLMLIALMVMTSLSFFEVNYTLTVKYVLILTLSVFFTIKSFYKGRRIINLVLSIFFISFFVLDFIFFVQLDLTWLYFFQILFTISSVAFIGIMIYSLFNNKKRKRRNLIEVIVFTLLLCVHFKYLKLIEKSQNGLTNLIKADEVIIHFDSNDLENYLIDHNVVGASIGIIKDEAINFYSYGTLDKNTQLAPNSQSLFQIASVSKVFTGLLLSKAISDGRIDLNDSITYNLKTSLNDSLLKKITYKQLVTNTSGIPDLTASGIYWSEFIKSPLDPYKSSKIEEFTNVINRIGINENLKYEYSNVGFSLLAYSLTQIYEINYNNGIGYDDLLRKEVLSTLDLKNTTYFPKKNSNQNLSKAHTPLGFELPHWEHNMYHGAGGLYSTTEDLAKFVQSQMIVSNIELSIPINLTHFTYFKDNERTLGMPWNIENNGSLFWYTGYSYGNTSFIGFNKQTNTGIVILLNNFSLNIDKIGKQLLIENNNR